MNSNEISWQFCEKRENHGTQDSRVVPHRGTNWAALWLTAQIGRDAVLSESYGRGYQYQQRMVHIPLLSVYQNCKLNYATFSELFGYKMKASVLIGVHQSSRTTAFYSIVVPLIRSPTIAFALDGTRLERWCVERQGRLFCL